MSKYKRKNASTSREPIVSDQELVDMQEQSEVTYRKWAKYMSTHFSVEEMQMFSSITNARLFAAWAKNYAIVGYT